MNITVQRGSRITHEWPDVPTEDQVRQALQERMAKTWSLLLAIETLECDDYPDADDCLDNVALTVLARGKRVDQMTDADFALIGAHMAQWFHRHALLFITQLEQATVAQRLDDEAAYREFEAAHAAGRSAAP